MALPPDLTDDLLHALTHAVRFLSLKQVARGWFGSDEKAAAEAVRALASRRLLVTEERFVHPELPATAPVLCWTPTGPAPDFRPASYVLRSRWSNTREETALVTASDFCCQRYGGSSVRSRASELSHDLHMGAVFLAHRELVGDQLTWRSGDWLRSAGLSGEFGTSIPDAVLLNRDGLVTALVEGGGSYSTTKLSEIHSAYRHYPYTVW